MNDSVFKPVLWLFALLCLPLSLQAADDPDFREGAHYQRLSTAVSPSADGKIKVVEAFSYRCPHCYHLEPALAQWLEDKPENIEFSRLPVTFNRPDWELAARTYYAAEVLGVLERIDRPFYEAIHAQGRPLNSEAALAEFFAEHGVEEEAFHKVFNSFEVETKLRRSQELVRRYGVSSVPSFIVDGRYLTNASMTGSEDRLFEVINYLVNKESDRT